MTDQPGTFKYIVFGYGRVMYLLQKQKQQPAKKRED